MQAKITSQIPVTYFYKDEGKYKVEARYLGSRISFEKFVETKEEAMGIEKTIKLNRQKYL